MTMRIYSYWTIKCTEGDVAAYPVRQNVGYRARPAANAKSTKRNFGANVDRFNLDVLVLHTSSRLDFHSSHETLLFSLFLFSSFFSGVATRLSRRIERPGVFDLFLEWFKRPEN